MANEKQIKFYCLIEDAYGYHREIIWNASSFAEAEQKCRKMGDIQNDERIQSITAEYPDG